MVHFSAEEIKKKKKWDVEKGEDESKYQTPIHLFVEDLIPNIKNWILQLDSWQFWSNYFLLSRNNSIIRDYLLLIFFYNLHVI